MTMRTHRLPSISPQAPYMPVASVGLLAALRAADCGATLTWRADDDPLLPPELSLSTRLEMTDVAHAVAGAPWPALDRLAWPKNPGQAIKPSLDGLEDPIATWHDLGGLADGGGENDDDDASAAARRLVASLLTDGSLDKTGLPNRSRLLRGVKADLSGVGKPPKVDVDAIAAELASRLLWRSGSSGLGLGLVPEVQTFGGTTGPNPSAVGAYSPLLYRLCWLGIMAMPPFGVVRGTQRVVGGPLFAKPDVLTWPVWTMPLDQTGLTALFGTAALHAEQPDRRFLRARGISAVYRSRARRINSMIAVFGWGEGV